MRRAIANSPQLYEHVTRNGLTMRQALADPTALQLREAYLTAYDLQKKKAEATLSAEAKAALKTLPTDAGDSVAGYLHSQRLLDQLSKNFTKEELDTYVGWFNNPVMRTKQAAATLGKALGIDLGTVDRKFLAFKSLVGQIRSTMFSIGGKQLTNTERPVIEEFIPTGQETGGSDELVEKARQFDTTARSRVADLLATHGVGQIAIDKVLARQPAASSLFPEFAPVLGPEGPPTTTPTTPPAGRTSPPTTTPGTTTTTTTLPPRTAGAGTQPPGGGAPPAPGAERPPYQPFQQRPTGGIAAKEAAKGSRAYDIALAERLNLAPEFPGETPEETQARRQENVARTARGEPPIPRRPVELPGGPGQFARRLGQTAIDVTNPRKLGQTAWAGLGTLGSPGAVTGSATEELSGSRGAGTAVDLVTNILAGGGATRRLASPAVVAGKLQALEPEMAAAISRASQVVNAVPAGGRLTPEAAQAAKSITKLLDKAATLTKPGDQAILVNRAVGIADDFLKGARSPTIDALRDLGQTQRQLATSYGTRMGIRKGALKAAGILIPTALVLQFRDAIGRTLMK
jgi:hypothetical protein